MLDSTAIGMSWEELSPDQSYLNLHFKFKQCASDLLLSCMACWKDKYYYYFLFNALFGPLFGSMKANLCTMGKARRKRSLPYRGCRHLNHCISSVVRSVFHKPKHQNISILRRPASAQGSKRRVGRCILTVDFLYRSKLCQYTTLCTTCWKDKYLLPLASRQTFYLQTVDGMSKLIRPYYASVA